MFKGSSKIDGAYHIRQEMLNVQACRLSLVTDICVEVPTILLYYASSAALV